MANRFLDNAMTKPLVPIANHKEKDARFLREFFLSVIKDENLATTATGMKVRVEAGKNLARLQHLLQVDKVSSKIPLEEQKAQREITEKEREVIKEALAGLN